MQVQPQRESCPLLHQFPLQNIQNNTTKMGCFSGTHNEEKIAVVPMHSAQEFQLFNTSVSLHGDWFSPAQDPDFEAMAAW